MSLLRRRDRGGEGVEAFGEEHTGCPVSRV